MNNLKDFDFFIDYVYTYCRSHLKEDGWSSQEFKQAVNLYKNKLQALEIIKDNKINGLELVWFNGMWFVFAPNCPRAIMYGNRKEDYDLLKKVFC